MNKLRRWIIHKLGGFAIYDIQYKEVVKDYWDKVHVSRSLYIAPSDYTMENAESIERELASQIGEELLRQNCILFDGPYADGDELRIRADCPALRIRDPKSYSAPSHLVFKEEAQ